MRLRSIDAFRGLAIVLMVFFTLTLTFSSQLPDLITHNVAGSLHAGDFVLPMFLFASGMSLVFFHEKRKKKKALEYALDVVERFGKLALVSFLLSPFTAGIFQMDEVMLSAILFLVCVVLVGLPEMVLVLVAFAVFAIYFALYDLSLLPDFSAYYLGGYPAAIFYLPVMLGGVIAGKLIAEKKGLAPALLGAGLLFVVLLLVVPPDKSEATPSFMALSVAVSLLVFVLIERAVGTGRERKRTSDEPGLVGTERGVVSGFFEYLGRQPINYWVLMFLLARIPLSFYAIYMGIELPLGLGWMEAVILAAAYAPLLYLVSRLGDFVSGMGGKALFNKIGRRDD